MTTTILVYGSLMRGFANHSILTRGGASYLGRAWTAPEFTMLDLEAFPGVVRGGTTAIVGELYDVDDATLARLDQLEGHPTFYRRSPVEISAVMDGPSEDIVEMYVLERSGYSSARPAVESGSWRRHVAERLAARSAS